MNLESGRNPIGWSVPTQVRAVPLKKISGRVLAVHVRVEAFARAMLGIAERSAGLISAAARPHFLGLQRDQRDRLHPVALLAKRRASAGNVASSFSERQIRSYRRVVRDRPGAAALENRRGRGVVPVDLS